MQLHWYGHVPKELRHVGRKILDMQVEGRRTRARLKRKRKDYKAKDLKEKKDLKSLKEDTGTERVEVPNSKL